MFNSLSDHPLFRQRAETTSLPNEAVSYTEEFSRSLDALTMVLGNLNTNKTSDSKNEETLDQTLTSTTTENSSTEEENEKEATSPKEPEAQVSPKVVMRRLPSLPTQTENSNTCQPSPLKPDQLVSQDGYLVPVEGVADSQIESDDIVCPFPFPTSNEIKTKTDLVSVETSFAKSFNSATPTHRYSNIVENSVIVSNLLSSDKVF